MQNDALFALAYIPNDDWIDNSWKRDGQVGQLWWFTLLLTQSYKYKALSRLLQFVQSNATVNAATTNCDVFKDFAVHTYANNRMVLWPAARCLTYHWRH